MRITERKLRSIIRSVIRESAQDVRELEYIDDYDRFWYPNVEKIGRAYFRHLHNGGGMSPQEWAAFYLDHIDKYPSGERGRVFNALEKAAKSPAHHTASGR